MQAPEPGAQRKLPRPNASRDAFRMSDPANDDDYNEPRPKKRGRPRKSDTEGRAPKRRSTGEASRRASNPTGQPKRRGRPPGSKNKTKTAKTIGKKGLPQALSGPHAPRHRESLAPRPSANRRPSESDNEWEDEEDIELPPSPAKPYTHIAPYVRRVRQATIEAKWSPLGAPSLKALTSILQLAHRPILQRLSNTQQRQTHTAAALRLVTNQITKKIARGLPFPPSSMLPARGKGSGSRGRPRNLPDGGREAELNFESVLDSKQELERQLDPALDAVELLRAEKERMEQELEMDYEALRNLQEGARAQAREQRELLKRVHDFAREEKNAPKTKDQDMIIKEEQGALENPFLVSVLIETLHDHKLTCTRMQREI